MSEENKTPAKPTLSGSVVWFEIPATDLKRAQAFYEKVLGIEMVYTEDPELPNPMVWFVDPKTPGGFGHLYPGKPAPKGMGNTIHILAADPLESVMERVREAGGEVVSPPIPVPDGEFFYALDLDGNSVGFFNFND